MLNATFLAAATAAFNQTPAEGPYTLAIGNTAVYASLPHLTPSTYPTIIAKIRAQITTTARNTTFSYLPPDIRSSPAMRAGYLAQLSALANLLSNPRAASLETPWASGTSAPSFLLHPLSRGTVRLNLSDPLAQPVLDYRLGANPVDFDLHLAHIRFLRQMVRTPTMRRYGAVEIAPGEGVDSGDEKAMVGFVKRSMTLSFMHPCCTAAMLPEERGGVVGTDLKVHGAGGRLRVVDVSVMPFLVGSHLSATAYAVGEKAAEVIVAEWRGKGD
jgi:choline dehydrogenase-like flavoprotein